MEENKIIINKDEEGNRKKFFIVHQYSKRIVASLVRQLREEFGAKGFDKKSIRRMMQLAQQFAWSHFVDIISLMATKPYELGLFMPRATDWRRRLRNS